MAVEFSAGDRARGHPDRMMRRSDPARSLVRDGHTALPAPAVCHQLEVDPERGLDAEETQRRLSKYGPNELP